LRCCVVFISSVNHEIVEATRVIGILKLDQALLVAQDGLGLNISIVSAVLLGWLSFVFVNSLELYDEYVSNGQVFFDFEEIQAT
jgi:hypothetical protein